MDKKLIITKIPEYSDITFCALFEENEMQRLIPIKEDTSRLSNIYVGKVDSMAKNLDAAFIDIGEEQLYFLNLEDAKDVIFTTNHSGKIMCGDEFLVQVDKEATKQKNPIVKTELALTGRYAVCFSKEGSVHYSSKMTNHQKTRISASLEGKVFPYEITIRTNAGINEDYEAIISEIEELCSEMETLINKSKFIKAKSCVYEAPKGVSKVLNNLYDNQFDEIVTDLPELPEDKNCFGVHSSKVRLYSDNLLPLYKLYGLEKEIERALSKTIYLKSGGFLVWEDTEALTAIDVNSGGYTKGSDKQSTFMKINLEAAKEIARQIQIRNTSGIIIVDLINVRSHKDREEIFKAFEKEMKLINNAPHVVDITKLGLLEMTRKKQEKTLRQIIVHN